MPLLLRFPSLPFSLILCPPVSIVHIPIELACKFSHRQAISIERITRLLSSSSSEKKVKALGPCLRALRERDSFLGHHMERSTHRHGRSSVKGESGAKSTTMTTCPLRANCSTSGTLYSTLLYLSCHFSLLTLSTLKFIEMKDL
mgnify:CR=1 FL=1